MQNLVEVSAHTRNGHKVSFYTRSAPGGGGSGGGVNIEDPLASNFPNNQEDTLAIKKALNELGYYEPPEWGLSGQTEAALYEGIKNFQKDNKLAIDGRINPGGETIKTLNTKLIQAKSNADSSPMSERCKNVIADKESRGHGSYKAHAPEAGNDIGAVGKYQMRTGALIDTKYLGANKKWTGKDGVNSIEDFKNNPKAQEKAFDSYLKNYDIELKNKGLYKTLNNKIDGKLGKEIIITKSGLLAAAHRAGPGWVDKYIKALEKNSAGKYYINYNKLTSKDKLNFELVETRIRECEDF